MARERIPLDIGLRLDVLDNEGIWNTGVIVDVAKDDENDDDLVEIKYDGWGDEYNEWVPVSKQRLAPLHMFTIVKKCWAKLNKWPWWPAFVVLRAPTKRGAVEALDAETKVYVEFFDSFEEDKRSRCWMQKKSVVSFDDNFEDRAAKNVGKNFHKFVEHTQRALASGSPLLFAGAGTLPIEYSSKSPLSFVVQKQKVGNKDWFEAFKSFSDRYRVLYGFEVAKNGAGSTVNTANLPTIQRAGEDDEVAEGNGYADEDESEEKDEPEEDEASANEEDDEEEEEEAVESVRGRRSARGTKQAQQPKRKLPTRASTRGNASKRVKVIEQLLQDTAYVKGRQQQQQLPSSSQGLKPKPKPRSVGNATAPLSSSSSCRPGEISRSEQNQVPVLLSQEDEGEEEDGNASNGKRRTAKDSASSQPPHSSLLNADVINILELLPISSEQKKSALPLASTATTASTSSMMVSWSEHEDDSQIFVISSEPPTNSTTTTTTTTSAFRSSVIMRSSSASPAASKTIKSKSSTFRTPAKNTRSSSPSASSFHRRKSPRKVSVIGDFGQDQDHVFNTNQKNEDKQDLDSEEDEEDMFRFWNGGSRYEINREPWKIQSWLLHGLKQKLEEPSS